MQEYLIYKLLAGAITASLIIWYNMTKHKVADPKDVTTSYADPIELEGGDYAIPKPADEYMEGVEYDSISSTIKPKTNGNNIDLGDSPSGNGPSSSDASSSLAG